jgi:hypothetical protein
MSSSSSSSSNTHVVAVDGSSYADWAFQWALMRLPKQDTIVVAHAVSMNFELAEALGPALSPVCSSL